MELKARTESENTLTHLQQSQEQDFCKCLSVCLFVCLGYFVLELNLPLIIVLSIMQCSGPKHSELFDYQM
jgi:hypothetical protein